MGRLVQHRWALWATLWIGYLPIAHSNTQDQLINLADGCAIYTQSRAIFYRSEGRCKNGLAEGFWSLGVESIQKRIYLYNHLVDGRQNGITFIIRPERVIIMVRENVEKPHFIKDLDRNASPAELVSFLASIDEANAVARKLGKPVGDAAKMKSIVRKWKQGDDSILDQWVTGPGVTGSGTSPSAATAARDSGGVDDPRTVGRGMRGG